MTQLCILADDLTGALDSAARFTPVVGIVPATWLDAVAPECAAIDSASRDADAATARAAVAQFAPSLRQAKIAFKKIDSLLRGHVRMELEACMDEFDHCILAPAFPFQGRITRHGRQWVKACDGWQALPVDLQGIDPRVQVHDAETDADLAAIVAHGRTLSGRTLWCGTGGLAGALAGNLPVARPTLPKPVLALIGSDHPVSLGQVAAAALWHVRISLPGSVIPAVLPAGAVDRLARDTVVTIDLPPRIPRALALRQMTATFHALLKSGAHPGTLVVAGGETLRALCSALGVERLDVDGEIEAGAPTSIMRGGEWDGQRVVSKSGAFGDVGFLVRLLKDG